VSPRPHPEEQPSADEPAWKRRRRLDQVFGDVLPETTTDERDTERSPRGNDQWLRDQVPPHHGG
jgi:hypothetical protein